MDVELRVRERTASERSGVMEAGQGHGAGVDDVAAGADAAGRGGNAGVDGGVAGLLEVGGTTVIT